MEDERADRDQHEGQDDVSEFADRSADRAVIDQPEVQQAPDRGHGQESSGSDDDLAGGAGGEKRRLDTQIVAAIGDGHRRDGDDLAQPRRAGPIGNLVLGRIDRLAQVEQLLEAQGEGDQA